MSRSNSECASEALKEKTRLARAAAATLYKLDAITKQVENWRDDRAKLRSNIWRLKLALGIFGKPETAARPVSLIEQRAIGDKRRVRDRDEDFAVRNVEAWRMTISRKPKGLDDEASRRYLDVFGTSMPAFDAALTSDSALRYLERKLREFVEGDQTVEVIFCRIAGKFAETVMNLSEELVNANEHAQRYRTVSEELRANVDRLAAQLKRESDNRAVYQKKSNDLDNLVKRLESETSEPKNARDVAELKLEDEEILRTDFEKVGSELAAAKNEIRMKEQFVQGILRERESRSKRQLANVKQTKEGINAIKRVLTDLRFDRETLIKEAEKIYGTVVLSSQRIVEKSERRMRNASSGFIDLKTRSYAESRRVPATKSRDANPRREIDVVKGTASSNAGLGQDENARDIESRLLRGSKIDLKKAEESLSEANGRIAELKAMLEQSVEERKTLEMRVVELVCKNETLSHRLNIEESTNGETLREYERVTSEYNALQRSLESLAKRNKMLDGKLAEAEEKIRSSSEKEVELHVLKEEISKYEASTDDLKLIIGKTRADLAAADVKLVDFREENLRLESSLNVLALKNVNIEARLQTLSAEKTELLARNVQLKEENDALKCRLNADSTSIRSISIATDNPGAGNTGPKSINAALLSQQNLAFDSSDPKRRFSEEEKGGITSSNREMNDGEVKSQMRLSTKIDAIRMKDKMGDTIFNNDDKLYPKMDVSEKTGESADNGIKAVLIENENTTRNKLRKAEAEMQALKSELFKTREEKQELRSGLNVITKELSDLELERIAMKNELAALRETKSRHRLETSTLQDHCRKLEIRNVELENKLFIALTELNKCDMSMINIEKVYRCDTNP